MKPSTPSTTGERPADEKEHIFDNPRNVKRLIRGFFVACALILALDLAIHRHLSFAKDTFPAEGFFGFYAFYGFAACVLLVVLAKEMRKILMRSEEYYDR